MTDGIRSILAGAIVIGISGCGGLAERPVDADPDPGFVDATSPADGDTGVALLTDVLFTLADGADADTVSEETVQVWQEAPDLRLHGTVSYDPDARRIEFTPDRAFSRAVSVRAALNGVTDPEGGPVETSIRFRTALNPDSHGFIHLAGQVAVHYVHELEDGRAVRTRQYGSAGPDGEWETSDDVLTEYADIAYSSQGSVTRRVVYSGPGVDDDWFTSDDVIDAWLDRRPSATGMQEVILVGEGLDGAWFTDDDEVRGYLQFTVDEDQRIVRTTRFTGAGMDLSWFTTDDAAGSSVAFVYDAEGFAIRETHYSAGPDTRWETGDDVVGTTLVHDWQRGSPSQRVQYSSPGADGEWFTSDDAAESATRWFYDGQGRPSRRQMAAVGDDGDPFSEDDIIWNVADFIPFAKNLSAQEILYNGEGADGVWMTADDVAYFAIDRQYEPSGLLGRETRFASVGPDGAPFTDDDVLDRQIFYDTAH